MFNDLLESFSKEQPVCSLIESGGHGLLKFPEVKKLKVIPCNHGVDPLCFSRFGTSCLVRSSSNNFQVISYLWWIYSTNLKN